MSRPAFGLLGIAIVLMMSSGPAVAEPPRFIDYLYVNASEGSASGGHVALRFGDQVFHFEHRPPGTLVLARCIRQVHDGGEAVTLDASGAEIVGPRTGPWRLSARVSANYCEAAIRKLDFHYKLAGIVQARSRLRKFNSADGP